MDYHKHFSYATIMDDRGRILKEDRLPNERGAVEAFLGEYAGPDCAAVLEATRNWTVMHDWLEALCGSVTLAHAKKVRAIAEAKVKTDKVDAATLAHLLRCDLIPPAHVSSPSARILKNILRHRMFLVKLQTMTKNRIHVVVDRHPEVRALRTARELFSRAGITWLKQVSLPSHERAILDNELLLLDTIQQRIKQANKALEAAAQDDPRIARLMTLPGIGAFFAMLIISEIDDIGRFANPKKLHAYAGLVPSTYASGGRQFHGRIIKASNPYLR
jgi:transposase